MVETAILHGTLQRLRRADRLRLRAARRRPDDRVSGGRTRGHPIGTCRGPIPVPPRRGGRRSRSSSVVPGPAAREVRTFATPGVLDADRLIASETLTPAADGRRTRRTSTTGGASPKTELEEIYFYQVADGPSGPGMAYQRGVWLADARGRPARRGPHGRRRAHPRWLAWPVDGGPGLRPVLPQRDGRTRPGSSLADHDRSRPRLGRGHLAGPIDRRPPAVLGRVRAIRPGPRIPGVSA